MAETGFPGLAATAAARRGGDCQADRDEASHGQAGARKAGVGQADVGQADVGQADVGQAGVERRGRLSAAWVLVPLLCLSLWPGLYHGWLTWRHVGESLATSTGTLVVRDFVQFWGGAHLVWAGHALNAFHPAGFQAWLEHRFAPATDVDAWSYPPSFLLLVTPLGAFGLLPAYAVWLAATLAMLVVALRSQRFGSWFVAAVLASPAALATILAGQNGALTAALLVGGFGLLDRRPVLAGVLFGLLTIKPQLGLLVPVALLAGGYWRTIVAAVATTLGLVLASSLAFGWRSWWLFATRTRPYLDHLLALPMRHQAFQLMMPTGFMTARDAGAGLVAAGALQAVLAVAAAVWMWRLWSRPAADREIRLALSLVLVFLATPYGYDYDMIPVAVGAAVLAARGFESGTLPGESVALVAWVLPAIVVILNLHGLGLLAPAALIGLAVCLQRRLGVNRNI